MADQPDTVFAQETELTQTPAAAPSTPEVKTEVTPVAAEPYADLLSQITREDGTQKYANVPDVIKAVQASQSHIAKLEAEAAETKAELTKRMSAEEVLEKLKANTNTQEATPSEGLDISQITELVEGMVTNTLSSTEIEKVSKANVNSVIGAMTTKFGTTEQAEKHFIETAEANGMSVEEFNILSAKSPQAVLKLAGVDAPTPSTPGPSTGSINTEALQPNVNTTSLKVPQGASAKDMASVWRAAGTQT